jgi:hypothetical protein
MFSWLRNQRPVYIENSRVPVWLSKLAPIDIWAISFGFWVWCRGELSETTKRHEAIHFQQQLELLFALQWILYGVFWLIGLIKYRKGAVAYFKNLFEQEAYSNESDVSYLDTRKRYSWAKYKF